MVAWLNQNQGFVMSLLTAVYVIATIVIVFYNHKSIKEMRESREAENRPYIFAYLHKDPRDTWLSFRIKNSGKTGAQIKEVIIEPSLKFYGISDSKSILKNVVMAPEQSLQFLLSDKAEEIIKTNYSFSITYSPIGVESKVYKGKYNAIIQYANLMGYSDHHTSGLSDEANALNNIAGYLDSIRNKF